MTKEIGWWEFLYGLYIVALDIFLQKIRCSHLPKRLPLQLSPHVTAIVTGATSGIGVEISGLISGPLLHDFPAGIDLLS